MELILIIILLLGMWIGFNLWMESNGFFPALIVPMGISIIIDLFIYWVFK